MEELREELALLKLKTSKEDERLRRLVHGSGTGRPKSAEFEFASRTILATGTHDPDPNINPCMYGTYPDPAELPLRPKVARHAPRETKSSLLLNFF